MSDDMGLIRSTVAAWVKANGGTAMLRAARGMGGHGFDPATLVDMAALGWPGALLPEMFGASELGFAAMGAIPR